MISEMDRINAWPNFFFMIHISSDFAFRIVFVRITATYHKEYNKWLGLSE